MPDPTEFFDDPNDGKVVTIRANGRRRVATVNNSDSRTVQADREQAEIRRILAKYEMTGVIENLRQVDLQFRDVHEFSDLSEALQQAKEAEAQFMQLDPHLRSVFKNDVSQWLDASHDGLSEEQTAALQRLGALPGDPETTPGPSKTSSGVSEPSTSSTEPTNPPTENPE